MKSTNKYLNVESQVVLFLLFRNYIFSIYIKKSLKKITDNLFPLYRNATSTELFSYCKHLYFATYKTLLSFTTMVVYTILNRFYVTVPLPVSVSCDSDVISTAYRETNQLIKNIPDRQTVRPRPPRAGCPYIFFLFFHFSFIFVLSTFNLRYS